MARMPRVSGLRKRIRVAAKPGGHDNSSSESDDGFKPVKSVPFVQAPSAETLTDETPAPDDVAAFETGPALSRDTRTLQGRIESLMPTEIGGWAWDPQTPYERIQLELVEGETRLAVSVASRDRPDLAQLGCGDGRHGFSIGLDHLKLPEGRHTLSLRCVSTGAEMPGSPIVIEARSAAAELPPVYRAYIDKVSDQGILGWIMMPDQPSFRYTVVLKERDHILRRAVASRFRQDLLSAGVGDGCYAFVFEPPHSLRDGQEHMLHIVEEETGTSLTREPIRWRIKAGTGQTPPTRPPTLELADRASSSTDITSVIRGVMSQMLIRNDQRMNSEASQEVTISLAKMQSLAAAEAVFHGYQTILGCSPSVNRFQELVGALRRGALDRRQLIELLRREPRARRVRLIEDAPESGAAAAIGDEIDERVFYSANEFATDDADAFLTAAYRAILKRDPAPSDRAAYRDSVADNTGQFRMLASLLGSDEFRARRKPLAILGITPDDEMFKTLFSMTERMSQLITEQEYELCTLRHRLEAI
jgi:hypothetical protein